MIRRTAFRRALAGTLCFAAAAFSYACVEAAPRFWITPAGGAFGTPGVASPNWSAASGGAGNATAPTTTDDANFDLNNIYDVTFASNVTNVSMDVEGGSNVTFQLGGFTYTLTNSSAGLEIGTAAGQSGRLTLLNGVLGADTTGDNFLVGSVAGSTGFLTVGSGGQVGTAALRPDVVAGSSGTGTLSVQNNGKIFADLFRVGNIPGGTGTATITGPQALLDIAGTNIVGNASTGTMTLSAGAELTSTSTTTIASGGGSTGTVNVTDAGTHWSQTGSIDVGSGGVGTLNVQAGGSLATATGFVGDGAGGFGAANINGVGSVWTAPSIVVGTSGGEGVLSVSGGGRVSTTSNSLIANTASSQGSAIVNGLGSRMEVGGFLFVGEIGTGSLTVSGGGLVTCGQCLIANSNAAGNGTITIADAGSSLVSADDLLIGLVGVGTANVRNGGNLSVADSLTIGTGAGANVGTLNFDGGNISTGAFVRAAGANFNWTDGTLTIGRTFGGGTFDNAGNFLVINGADADDRPTLRLTNNSVTTPTQVGALTVGSFHAGALEVTGGASLQAPSIDIGSVGSGDGVVTVGAGSSLSTSVISVNVGGTAASAGGKGELIIESGATVTTNLRIWPGGTVTLDGGRLDTNQIVNNDGKFNFNSGTVHFFSSLTGNLNPHYDTLLGTEHRLLPGRSILYDQIVGTTGTNLIVDGGTLVVAGGLILNTNSNLEMQSENITSLSLVTDSTSLVLLQAGNLVLTTTFSNQGELRLAATNDVSLLSGTTLFNAGLLHGNGRINMVLTNNTGGQVRAEAGDHLVFGGTATNAGNIEVAAGGDLQFLSTLANNATTDVIGGTLRVEGAATNAVTTGFITGRNAILRFNGGLTNNGRLALSFGTSDVFGAITNSATGRIIVSGNSQATFNGNVVNNGAIQVSSGSTAVYFGNVSGTGTYTGGGTNFYEGTFSPGASPALITFGGNVAFGGLATLEIELAGLAPGTQFDRLTTTGNIALDGALDVSLLAGFQPNAGDAFEFLHADGNITGTFATENLPALRGGLYFDVRYAAQSVTLVAVGALGDYNRNGKVDAADYTVWRNALNQPAANLAADGNGDHLITRLDLDVWKAHFGESAILGAGALTAAVPEPSSAILLLFAIASFGVLHRRHAA